MKPVSKTMGILLITAVLFSCTSCAKNSKSLPGVSSEPEIETTISASDSFADETMPVTEAESTALITSSQKAANNAGIAATTVPTTSPIQLDSYDLYKAMTDKMNALTSISTNFTTSSGLSGSGSNNKISVFDDALLSGDYKRISDGSGTQISAHLSFSEQKVSFLYYFSNGQAFIRRSDTATAPKMDLEAFKSMVNLPAPVTYDTKPYEGFKEDDFKSAKLTTASGANTITLCFYEDRAETLFRPIADTLIPDNVDSKHFRYAYCDLTIGSDGYLQKTVYSFSLAETDAAYGSSYTIKINVDNPAKEVTITPPPEIEQSKDFFNSQSSY